MDILKNKENLISLAKNNEESSLAIDFTNDYLSLKGNAFGFSKSVISQFNSIYDFLEVDKSISDLFLKKIVNTTENQSALHWELRGADNFFQSDLLSRVKNLKKNLLDKNIKNIITLGIGGSYEGPKLLIESLTNSTEHVFNHFFISGSDPDELNECLASCESKETIFIVSSKSMTTAETLQNYKLAYSWLSRERRLSDKDLLESFYAVTANDLESKDLGFLAKNTFVFSKEIGGRYSIWSSISLPALLEIEDEFINFLSGACKADKDLKKDSKYLNIIKTLSFIDIWNSNFLNKSNRVILSYAWKLRSITDYLQQLEMESLGKASSKDSIFSKTGQTIYGGYGPNAQHSYFQLLHQGTSQTAIDMIYIENENKKNLIDSQVAAQSDLFNSFHEEFKNTHIAVNSDVSVNLFKLNKLNAFNLGFLLASWEHKVFITAQMLQINPFDQFGVEAGKRLAKKTNQ
ncbi:hypothetical protein N9T42_00015 [SAR86 cluster bacterium]|nr:hypothetical protein [SAR86 cluster bacterium]